MQIFRYMVYIWKTYEREEEKQKKGISKQKEFKYPPILPIAYYEGRQEWKNSKKRNWVVYLPANP